MIKLTQQGAPYSLVEKATPICYQGNYALLPWQIRLSQMGILDTWFVRLLSISTVRMVRVLRPNEIASYCRSSQISLTPTHISAISHYSTMLFYSRRALVYYVIPRCAYELPSSNLRLPSIYQNTVIRSFNRYNKETRFF